jgi:ABC-type transport system substrate-binding protein
VLTVNAMSTARKGDAMNLLNQRRRLSRRSVPLLLAGIIGGAAVLSPVMGSAATFLTKKKADKRYLGNSAVATTTISHPGGNTPGSGTVSCPPGRQALSGGADSPLFLGDDSSNGMIITETRPVVSGGRATGWSVDFITGINPLTVTIHAVCAP